MYKLHYCITAVAVIIAATIAATTVLCIHHVGVRILNITIQLTLQ